METYKSEEVRKSAKEGGLEKGIHDMRTKIATLDDMVNQIELLQKVPAQYRNLAGDGKVDERELPALDQWETHRNSYDGRYKEAEEALTTAYMKVLDLLDVLRSATGISSKEETLKFDKDTGRQEKDK